MAKKLMTEEEPEKALDMLKSVLILADNQQDKCNALVDIAICQYQMQLYEDALKNVEKILDQFDHETHAPHITKLLAEFLGDGRFSLKLLIHLFLNRQNQCNQDSGIAEFALCRLCIRYAEKAPVVEHETITKLFRRGKMWGFLGFTNSLN